MERLAKDLAEIAEVDAKPVSDKNLLSMIMSPKKDIDKILGITGKISETDETEMLEEENDE